MTIVGWLEDILAVLFVSRIEELKDVTDKTKYEIKFYLTKDKNNEWVLDDITDIDRQKLHGLYEQ